MFIKEERTIQTIPVEEDEMRVGRIGKEEGV